ncbi:FAD-binding oxidoreductase [Muricoccus pecuniae]|uniref:FAD/FMN-containing dehydrogenase n=1 Tax=Muricoccus pecuniae TaxID=693023 RepID=A0A840Y5J3_9PROT|nr:FAD-binding oxidoreductase [Roseomonas pecuniae]MBB5696408.1 FAD/FMN-containing dehydrogenase [Roseomonas pecuniae]
MKNQGQFSSKLQELLGPQGVVTDPSRLARYCADWSGDLAGIPLAVARPADTAGVAAVLRLCAGEGVPVVPQGGHTGLVGGAVPSPSGNELVLSLERLDRVRSVDPVNFSMVAEAGCVLETLHCVAQEHDLLLPLSLGAKGSCQIGGNIATNAGGVNVLRYGMARDLVLGLEVVLPDGRIWNGLRSLRKNNTGYDLKQLFIGSEGTLGVVTAAVLKLFPRPTQVQTVMLGLDSVSAAMGLYAAARRDLSDLLSAFELMPRGCIDLTLRAIPGLRDPLPTPAPVYVLMEASACGLVDLAELTERFLARRMELGGILDGIVATSQAQAADFWRIREGLVEAQHRHGRHLRTDVSVPISCLPGFLEQADAELARHLPAALPVVYGHVGDGNIHYNLLPPKGLPEAEVHALLEQGEALIFALVDRFGGSISAEHGIGRVKREPFEQRLSAEDRDLLRALRSGIDPHNRMSPGRLFA